MKLRLGAVLITISFALLIAACGTQVSSQSSSQPVTISLSPSAETVETGNQLKLSVTVGGTYDPYLDWSVNGVAGGNSTIGTVSSTGLYTAPDVVPSDTGGSADVTVTVALRSDPTKSASSTLTIWGLGSVKVSPSTVTVPAGATQQFTASMPSTFAPNFYWSLTSNPGGSEVGTIDFLSGLYTAPLLPPMGGAVTVVSYWVDYNVDLWGTATATIAYSNASLQGPYVFSFSGNDPNGPVYIAGRFVADGAGTITDGVSDVQHVGSPSVQQALTGAYTVQPDGRGTLTFTLGGSQQTASYKFALTSAGGGPLLRFENTANGTGQIYKQDSASFSNASLSGAYAFHTLASSLSGTLAEAGVFGSDGAGNITAGMKDVNDGQNFASKVPLAGTYAVDASGRTTATITTSGGSTPHTSQLVMYLISGDRAVFIDSDDSGAAGAGGAEKQQTASFSNGSLSGDFVYVSTGEPATKAKFSVGRFTSDGAGAVNAGILDQNNAGTLSQVVSFTGAYSIPATDMGRGTGSFTTPAGTINLVLYVVSDKLAYVVGADPASVEGGQLLGQSPVADSSFLGNLAFSWNGVDSLGRVGAVGGVVTNGSGNLSGSEDLSDAGALNANVSLSGNYSVGQNGRGQLAVTAGGSTSTFNVYVVDSSNAILIGADSGVGVMGRTARQF